MNSKVVNLMCQPWMVHFPKISQMCWWILVSMQNTPLSKSICAHILTLLIFHWSPIGKGTPIGVVIGMDNSHLLLPLEVRFNSKSLNEPYATRSVFGRALQGHLVNSTLSEITSNFIQLEHKLDRMWEIENDDFEYKSHSVDDRKVVYGIEKLNMKTSIMFSRFRGVRGMQIYPITSSLPNAAEIASLDDWRKRIWLKYMTKTSSKW